MLTYRLPMRRVLPRTAMSAALAAMALVLCACNDSQGERAPGGDVSEMVDEGEVAPHRYVALGDSYTAAPLRLLPDEVKGCMRSKKNYPHLVAAELDNTELVDVSCSGASTDSMFEAQGFDYGDDRRPPQLDALTPDTDLVTVSIGANDFRLFRSMMIECLEIAKTDPDGAPCRESNTRGDRDRLERTIDRIEPRVGRVVDDIRERAPEARVLVVGYPRLLPATGSCPHRLPLAKGDYDYARGLNERLAEAVRDGGIGAGADYVNLYRASKKHDICSDEPWIAGIRGAHHRAMGLHPYPREQEAVAELILDMVQPLF